MRNMRPFSRYSAALITSLSFGVAACGDDEETPKPTPDTVDDTGSDTGSDTGDDVGSDTNEPEPDTVDDTGSDTGEPVDPCAEAICDNPPAAKCDGNSVVAYAAEGTCAEATGKCTYAEGTATPCAQGEVCSAGTCIASGDLCSYDFGPRVSYVTEIRVPLNSEPACCFDLNGDGGVDNKLAGLINTISGLAGIDVNAIIAEQIEAGTIALLLETQNVTDIANSSGVVISGFYGADADADPANNAAGTSEFTVNPSSFIEGTAHPYISFPGATIENSILKAGPSQFRLQLPVLGILLDLAINGTQIESPVSAGVNGATGGLAWGGADGAKLGGYVAVSTLATALNSYLEVECSCFGKTDTSKPYVYTQVETTQEVIKLNVVDSDTCTGTCDQIGGYVGMAGGIISGALAPDIDHDHDGIRESISLGVRLKATSATISGVDSCQ